MQRGQFLLDGIHGRAQRNARGQIKGNSDCRELAEVTDGEGTDSPRNTCNCPQWDEMAASRSNIKFGDSGWLSLVFREQFHDDPVLVHRRINGRNLALTVCVV